MVDDRSTKVPFLLPRKQSWIECAQLQEPTLSESKTFTSTDALEYKTEFAYRYPVDILNNSRY